MKEDKKTLKQIPEEEINSISNLFSILSNPSRIKILWLLKKKKNLSVHAIQEKLKISQSNVSQHLSLLKTHKIIKEERIGKEVYYSIVAPKKLSKILVSALHLIGYQLAANSEILSTYSEVVSFWV